MNVQNQSIHGRQLKMYPLKIFLPAPMQFNNNHFKSEYILNVCILSMGLSFLIIKWLLLLNLKVISVFGRYAKIDSIELKASDIVITETPLKDR